MQAADIMVWIHISQEYKEISIRPGSRSVKVHQTLRVK